MSISNIGNVGVNPYACTNSSKKAASTRNFAEEVQKAEESRETAEKTTSSAWAGDMVVPQPPRYFGFIYDSSISNKSKEEMTMDEYKQWFMNEMSGMPVSGWYRSTCVGGALTITEECFERMKNDPEWEKTVLGMVRNMYSSSGLMGSKMIGYQVIGATPEQCHGEGIPVKDGSPLSADNEESWWEKRHKRMEELMKEQEADLTDRGAAEREKRMEISNNQSWYVNPNTRSFTSNLKNTAVSDWEAVKETMFDEMEPVEDLMTAIKTPMNLAKSTSINKAANSVNLAVGTQIRINDGYVLTVKTHGVELSHTEDYDPYDQEAYLKAEQMAGSLYALLRNAGGTMTRLYHTEKDCQLVTEGITNVLSYLGIDASKDFYVNGMKYSKNGNGLYESQANSEAKAAYEMLTANNRTYTYADEKTRNRIAYISNYYLENTTDSLKEAWQKTLEETGVNPFPLGFSSTLSQLAMEQDFATGGNDDIFGSDLESNIAAVKKIIERLENPLGAVSERNIEFFANEKTFYTGLLNNLA